MRANKGMKVAALVAVALVATLGFGLMLAACGIGTGPAQELTIDEALTGAAVSDVRVAMGAGKLDIQPGGSGLVSGVMRYNVVAWKPVVTRTDSSVTIKQGSTKGLSGVASDVVNNWQLKLGGAPIRLSVTAGAYEGTYELGGLSLQGLSIKDGASKSKLSFSSPNPSQMDSFTYDTGASSVNLAGLANANFKSMTFKGGAGSFVLDFSGQLRSDASVNVSAGVGSVAIHVPADIAAKVVVEGKLNNISQQGTWTVSGKTYATAAAGGSSPGKLLTINVKMDVGNLTLATS